MSKRLVPVFHVFWGFGVRDIHHSSLSSLSLSEKKTARQNLRKRKRNIYASVATLRRELRSALIGSHPTTMFSTTASCLGASMVTPAHDEG
jgi:hypothetical protein